MISFWESIEAVREFKRPGAEKADFYPRAKEFLFELEPRVADYEAVAILPSKA